MNEFPLSYLNGPELLTSAQSVQSILASSSLPDDVVLQKLLEQLSADIVKLSKALSVPRGSAYTTKTKNADIVFNKSFITFRNYCSVMATQISLPDIAEAAAQIITIIRSVDWNLNKRTIAQELAGAKALTDQMEKTSNYEALTKCNASEWYKHFSDAHMNLNSIYGARIDGEAVTTLDNQDLGSTKTDTRRHIEQVYSYCSVLDNVNNTAYGSLTARLDEVVSAILPGIRARKTRTANVSAAQAQETTATTDN